MEIDVNGNLAQLPEIILKPKNVVKVEGRGTGKSADIGFTIDRIFRLMPGCVVSLTGKTYGQLLTRTLPSSLKILNAMGYTKGIHYVIGRKPPSGFKDSYEEINKFDNVISFCNGMRIVMISQSEPGSGRGANVDYEIIDEALTINREQYNMEVAPTNRGNHEYFGLQSHHPIYLHHGFKYSTSMPYDKSGRWVLEYAEYYMKERGIQLFEIWNRIVDMQMQLLDCKSPREYMQLWNEIARVRKKITPFVSRDNVLFTIANAFDNLDFLKLSYIRKNYINLPRMIFLVEIMNKYFDKVEDCFYSLNAEKQIYYNCFDNDRLRGLASDTDYEILDDSTKNSIYYSDCDSSQPLELSFDWGSKICVMVVGQEHYYDFKTQKQTDYICDTQIAEYYTKPDGSSNMMIRDLIRNFCVDFSNHTNKSCIFYRDNYGDNRQPNTVDNQTYNEMAINELMNNGWNVRDRRIQRGNEPPMSDKYILWGLLLAEEDSSLPKIRFNGDRCKYLLLSMNNAKVKNVDNKLSKDKSSEHAGSGVLPEEATHFSDAIDKKIWIKYGEKLPSSHRHGSPIFTRF